MSPFCTCVGTREENVLPENSLCILLAGRLTGSADLFYIILQIKIWMFCLIGLFFMIFCNRLLTFFLSISLPPFRVTRRQMEPEALHNQSRITEIIIVRVAIITCKQQHNCRDCKPTSRNSNEGIVLNYCSVQRSFAAAPKKGGTTFER